MCIRATVIYTGTGERGDVPCVDHPHPGLDTLRSAWTRCHATYLKRALSSFGFEALWLWFMSWCVTILLPVELEVCG
jgi:hypothetical protein